MAEYREPAITSTLFIRPAKKVRVKDFSRRQHKGIASKKTDAAVLCFIMQSAMQSNINWVGL